KLNFKVLGYNEFQLQKVNGLFVAWYERCELEAQNPLPMTAVNIFSQRRISRNIHLRTLGWPIQINCTFWNILKSRIINIYTVYVYVFSCVWVCVCVSIHVCVCVCLSLCVCV